MSVVNAKPDGYTLLFGYGSGEDLVTPHTMKIPYDQFKDLVPVCQISIVSLVLSVPSAHPAKSLKEFVAWAKSQNRPITGAVSTRGASVDITMQAIMRVAGVNCQTAKSNHHPVIFRDRKAFLKNMTDGFAMYGELIEKLGLKQQQ